MALVRLLYAGSVPLAKQERLSQEVRRAREARERAEEEANFARDSRAEAETKLAEVVAKQDSEYLS